MVIIGTDSEVGRLSRKGSRYDTARDSGSVEAVEYCDSVECVAAAHEPKSDELADGAALLRVGTATTASLFTAATGIAGTGAAGTGRAGTGGMTEAGRPGAQRGPVGVVGVVGVPGMLGRRMPDMDAMRTRVDVTRTNGAILLPRSGRQLWISASVSDMWWRGERGPFVALEVGPLLVPASVAGASIIPQLPAATRRRRRQMKSRKPMTPRSTIPPIAPPTTALIGILWEVVVVLN
jgi:hypothetical protein